MAQVMMKKTVKGGWVARDAKSGEFVAVGTDSTVSHKSFKSEDVAKLASRRRSAALERLKDR